MSINVHTVTHLFVLVTFYGVIVVNAFGAWLNYRSTKATLLMGKVFTCNLRLDNKEVIGATIYTLTQHVTLGYPIPDAVELHAEPRMAFYNKLPSRNRMIYSLKPIKLESYFTIEEIIELTGTIPEE